VYVEIMEQVLIVKESDHQDSPTLKKIKKITI